MTRQEIENNYTMLQELIEMETLVANHLVKKENNQWMKIVTPHNEYQFLNSDHAREKFIDYLKAQIQIVKYELKLESEDLL